MACPNHVDQVGAARCSGHRGCECPCTGCGVHARKELYGYIESLDAKHERELRDLKQQFARFLEEAAKNPVQKLPRS